MIDVAALFLLIPACLALIRAAPSGALTGAAVVYSLGVWIMVGASALYHAPRWSTASLRWLQKIDFSAIYLLIAGTYTPVCLHVLGEPGKPLLVVTWVVAVAGIFMAFFWSHAPRWLRASIYVAFGWMVLPYIGAIWQSAGPAFVALVAAGGLLYSLSALVYVKRWGNFHPAIWGYHESMHTLVMSAVGCHFAAMWTLLVSPI